MATTSSRVPVNYFLLLSFIWLTLEHVGLWNFPVFVLMIYVFSTERVGADESADAVGTIATTSGVAAGAAVSKSDAVGFAEAVGFAVGLGVTAASSTVTVVSEAFFASALFFAAPIPARTRITATIAMPFFIRPLPYQILKKRPAFCLRPDFVVGTPVNFAQLRFAFVMPSARFQLKDSPGISFFRLAMLHASSFSGIFMSIRGFFGPTVTVPRSGK